MASAQINGSYAIYIENPAGQRKLVKKTAAYWWAPGGSVDGVIQNTPEKWNVLAPSADKGAGGYKIVVTLTAGANSTSDASDGAWVIPVIVNGTAQSVGNAAHASGLGNDNFTVTLTPGDYAYVANVETPVAIYTAKENVTFRVGGDRVFLSIENNA